MSFRAFCDSLYHDSIQIMRYKIFVINIIIEPKIYWKNPITYSDINRWYSNKVRCKKKTLTTVNQTVCNLCQHRVKCWYSVEIVLLWCGTLLLFALQSQCYCLLFRADVTSLRLVLLFPMGITHRVFSNLCLCLFNV